MVGDGCAANTDCELPASGKCTSNKCAAATCNDGVKNGNETDTDCGGTCGPTCAVAKICKVDSDCVLPASGRCASGKCVAAACNDGVKNGSETDTDCGGSCAAKCTLNHGCGAPTDCATPTNLCLTATCSGSPKVCGTGPAPNGTGCNDGNLCTQSDSCQGGVCTGANPKPCTTANGCLTATCNPSTGACGTTPADGKTCNDSNACTLGDHCQGGACTFSSVKDCTDPNPCMISSCNASNGTCTAPTPVPDNQNLQCGPTGTVCRGGACTCTTAGLSLCGSTCVNEATDLNNCGACGKVCTSSQSTPSCAAAQCCDFVNGCTPVTLGTTPNGVGVSIAVGPTAVYFTDGAGGHVYTCPLAGCTGTPTVYYGGMQLATSVIYDSSNGYVYVSDQTGLSVNIVTKQNTALFVRTNASDTFPAPIGQPYALATDGSSLYYSHNSGIGRANKTTGVVLNEVWSASGVVTGIGIDPASGNVWGVTGSAQFRNGSVASCDPAGGGCTSWNTSSFDPVAVHVVGSTPYLLDSLGSLNVCVTTSSCASPSFCLAGAPAPDVVFDATNLYHLSPGSITATPVANACSSGTMKTIAAASSIAAITDDTSYIYWITTAGVVRRTTKNVPGP